MSQRFYLPIPQIFTDLGTLAPGWKLYFYRTLTTTPLAVYSDVNLTVPLPNPVLTNDEGHLVDGSGNITSIYFSDASLYKCILTDENDIPQWTADPCDPFSVSLAVLSPRPLFYAGQTTGTSAAYVLTANPPFTSYSSSDIFELTFHTACAAGPTLQYVATGSALNLVKKTGQGTKIALQAGDVEGRHQVTNDGTDIIVLDPRNTNIYTGTTPTLTIASGVIAITNGGASYKIDTEGAASSDSLDTINGGVAGEIIVIRSVNSARDVIITNSGNIITSTGQNYTLETTNDRVVLQYDGSSWVEVAAARGVAKYYDSGEQAITASATLNLTHNLGKTPDIVRYYLICKTAERNWSIGDTIEYYSHLVVSANDENMGFETTLTNTQINIYYGNNANLGIILDKTTRIGGTITNANWRLVVRAYILT